MNIHVPEWLQLIVRWFHVIAAITWIGHAFFFNWLDRNLDESVRNPERGVEGELWMVHSGGFYQVEKKLVVPQVVPGVLHWFKWEAALTWLSGMLLLVLVYYFNNASLMIDADVRELSPQTAVGLGIGAILAGWFVYDILWRTPLKDHKAAPVVGFGLLIAGAFLLTHIFSGRAAYIHLGGIIGTMMVFNVWVHIIPSQEALMSAVKEGRPVDPQLAIHAKERSKHNNYLGYPVVAIMISNHYPASTYGHQLNWVMLAVILLGGACVRLAMNANMGKKGH